VLLEMINSGGCFYADAASAIAGNRNNEIETLAALCDRLTGQIAAIGRSQGLALLGALERLRESNERHGIDVGPQLLLALDRFPPIARRYSFTARPN
jgi:hypothetical protein